MPPKKDFPSTSALRISAPTHKATTDAAKKRKMKIDDFQRYLLRLAKITVVGSLTLLGQDKPHGTASGSLVSSSQATSPTVQPPADKAPADKAPTTPPAVSMETQLFAAKLHNEQAELKAMQDELTRRIPLFQQHSGELIQKLTKECPAPKWKWSEVKDDIGTKFQCEAAPAPAVKEKP